MEYGAPWPESAQKIAPIELEVTSTPRATLSLDGVRVGPTPQRLTALGAGEELEIRLEASGYEVLTRSLRVEGPETLEFALERRPQSTRAARPQAGGSASERSDRPRESGGSGDSEPVHTLNPFQRYP